MILLYMCPYLRVFEKKLKNIGSVYFIFPALSLFLLPLGHQLTHPFRFNMFIVIHTCNNNTREKREFV